MSGDSQAGRAHPLVGLLFWVLGKDLKTETNAAKAQNDAPNDEEDRATERIQRRSLSWKDDNPSESLATWHEFADVKAPDLALVSDKPQSSSLKSGTTLHRKQNTIDDNEEEEIKKRRSPNSPNWGFFVSITPPAELYPPPTGTINGTPSIDAAQKTVTESNPVTDKPPISNSIL
jgi:hypothetical protein